MTTPNIFCPEIQKSFEYVKASGDSFFPSGNSYSLFFCAQFRIPWILCWDFCTHQYQPSPFPKYLTREFKIKWWAAFKISQVQTFEAVKDWVEAHKPKQKILQSQNSRYQFGPNLYQAQLLGPKLKIHFLQIQHTGLISKKSKEMQLNHCPNSQT